MPDLQTYVTLSTKTLSPTEYALREVVNYRHDLFKGRYLKIDKLSIIRVLPLWLKFAWKIDRRKARTFCRNNITIKLIANHYRFTRPNAKLCKAAI